MAFVNFLSNFTNGLFRHFVCFEKFHSPVSELIHLARCVKFNPYFFPGTVLIVFCGTQSNRRTNFIPRLAGFNPRLALIVFSGTGARAFDLYLQPSELKPSNSVTREGTSTRVGIHKFAYLTMRSFARLARAFFIFALHVFSIFALHVGFPFLHVRFSFFLHFAIVLVLSTTTNLYFLSSYLQIAHTNLIPR